jgi:hypothetical protein
MAELAAAPTQPRSNASEDGEKNRGHEL